MCYFTMVMYYLLNLVNKIPHTSNMSILNKETELKVGLAHVMGTVSAKV